MLKIFIFLLTYYQALVSAEACPGWPPHLPLSFHTPAYQNFGWLICCCNVMEPGYCSYRRWRHKCRLQHRICSCQQRRQGQGWTGRIQSIQQHSAPRCFKSIIELYRNNKFYKFIMNHFIDLH